MMAQGQQFSAFSRLLHWTMAVLIVAMLFIGIGMVASISDYHWLLAIHRPLGIIILVLVAIRLVNRLFHPAPPLPADMPAWQRFAAKASHILLYLLMFALPLIGWGMLSAARYPVVFWGPWVLPPILPQNGMIYVELRHLHGLLALLLFAVFLGHLGAALLHALIHRDGVFESMLPWRRPAAAKVPPKR